MLLVLPSSIPFLLAVKRKGRRARLVGRGLGKASHGEKNRKSDLRVIGAQLTDRNALLEKNTAIDLQVAVSGCFLYSNA